ncbi:MAG TPA: mechanosensitive ion channel family protein [Bacillota bacterium]|nr:mechanosensitive ion channel family protein [Bacillota bacterium]HQD76486.1 mechanosensitive ion channel family protein [Bacillota bacterium]HUM58975.1 mechanosensitive ion channel family protein [Bacillota bacterium]
MWGEKHLNWQEITRRIEMFLAQNLEAHLVDLLLSLVVLAVTYILIKTLNRILNRILQEGSREWAEGDDAATEQSLLSDSMIRSLRILLQTLLLYGGYFFAALIILHIFNVNIISADDLKSIGTKLLKIIGVMVGAKLLINFGRMAIRQFFERHRIKDHFTASRRAETLERLLCSLLTYVVFFVAGVTILQIFNVNTGAILASAGILGLAVGFGAQSLVKDVISGFFIIFEDQFGVGDYVNIEGVEGTVEEIGLRTCKVRRWTGQLEILPNGSITRVTNYSRGQMLALVIIRIAYEEDIDRAIAVLQQESEVAYREMEAILALPRVEGVVELADSSVNIRITAPALPAKYWAVERELRRRFKNALDRAGIEIPYPRRVLYQREKELKTIKEQQKEENKKTDKRVSMAETAGTPECQQQILEEKGGTVL